MGNTSVKGNACSMKRSRHHHRSRRSRRRHYGGVGSPLNPEYTPSSSKTRKTKRKVEPSLHKLVLQSEAYKSRPSGPKKTRKSPPRRKTPVKRNFVVSEETILEEEEEEKPRRRSL